MSNPVVMEVTTRVKGRTWSLFTFEYDTPDGKFSGYFYAISIEHAAELLDEMKQTAKLVGQMLDGDA